MKKFKHTYKQGLGIFLFILFCIPMFVGLFHSLSEHNHEICFSKIEKHVHEKDIDCSLDVIKNSNSLLSESTYETFKILFYKGIVEKKNNFLTSHQQLYFSLRAPPYSTLT